MANAIVTQFSAMSAENRADLIENRASMAKTVLNMLLWSMQDDCTPSESEVANAISAAIELLNVPMIAA